MMLDAREAVVSEERSRVMLCFCAISSTCLSTGKFRAITSAGGL